MSTPEPPPYPGESNSGASGDLPSYGSVQPPQTPSGGDFGSVPPPPPPPAPPSYSGPQAFSAPDAIGWGWAKFKENMGPVILAVLAIAGISIVLGILGGLLTGGFSEPTMTATGEFEFSPASPLDLVSQLVQSVVSIVLTGVAARAALDVTEGRPFDFFGAFGRVNLVRLILASLIVGIVVILGFILLIIPGLIMLFLTYLTTYSVVDDDKSAIDAVKHSIKLISSNVGGALLLALLNILVMIAGFLALCVGLLVAIPITMFATAYAYRTFNGQAVAP